MANKHNNLKSLFKAIADAIRAKTGGKDEIVADEFPTAIESISASFDYVNSRVTSIPSFAFYECKELRIISCNNITSIGDNAFCNCVNLRSATIPEGVTSIGSYVFSSSTNLVELKFNAIAMPDLPSENKVFASIGNNNSPDLVVSIGSQVSRLPAYLFYPHSSDPSNWTNITEVYFEDNSVCEAIGDFAFGSCTELRTIDIPVSVLTIGKRAFYNCTHLVSINYRGTVSQWNSISLGEKWNSSSGKYTIHCIDGDIAKDGTITYK